MRISRIVFVAVVLMLAWALATASFAGSGTVSTLRGGNPLDAMSEAPPAGDLVEGSGKMPRSFADQPPLIPHPTENYAVSLKRNDCLNCHGAKGDGGLIDRLHGTVVRALFVGSRTDGDLGSLGRIVVGSLIDSVPEQRRRPYRHTTDLDVRVRREVDARVDRPGSLKGTEAHHIGLPRQNVNLDLAGGRRGVVGPRQDRRHVGGYGRDANKRDAEQQRPC